MDSAKKLALWVEEKHGTRLMKPSGESYFSHVKTVAEIAAPFAQFGYEVGLCHDLLEETAAGSDELYSALLKFGYTKADAESIMQQVTELTDVFTKAAYPHFSKTVRKAKEAERLAGISADAQTVKYADLLYNVDWMLQYDKERFKEYLLAKKQLLQNIKKGNRQLWQKLWDKVNLLLGY